MKNSILIIVLFCMCLGLKGQVIKGKVVDSSDGSPLQYASLGVIQSSIGTITNELGEFLLETRDSTLKSKVRFSMIGYESKTFSIEDLITKENTVELSRKPVQLDEIVITPEKEVEIIGANSYSLRGVSGWGGNNFAQGHEIGIKLNLGETYVKLENLTFRIHKQSFDSTMFRLHIRDIKNDHPNEELIDTNILFTVSNTSGWEEIILSQYNIVLKGEVVLSLEWMKVWGVNKNKMVKMNRSKKKRVVVLLSTKKNSGEMFIKRGVEANWRSSKGKTPSIYVTVQ